MKIIKRWLMLLVFSALMLTNLCVYAEQTTATIEETSEDWGNLTARETLLNKAPKWTTASIQLLFEEYKHPERHHLPAFVNGTRVDYNALFINAFWGPIDNPFTKLARPAKIFIFHKSNDGKSLFLMAPLIQNSDDKKYYVFDKSESQPTPLPLWVYNKTNGYPCATRFNVCTGYGTQPDDTCEGKGIENEVFREPQITFNRTAIGHTISPSRMIHQQWHTLAHQTQHGHAFITSTAFESSIPWNDIDKRQAALDSVVSWPNLNVIKNNYVKIRDLRYFDDLVVPQFKRRLSWLYPDDGCWTRTASIIKDFFGPLNNPVNLFPRPSKIIALGNLCLNTNNTRSGKITWWYHFAPIIRDAETKQSYVIDPTINPSGPMRVEDWMSAITSNSGNCTQNTPTPVTFNICNGYGTSPFEQCDLTPNVTFESEIRAEMFDKYFRKFERNRQAELGRDPNQVLGDNPPW